VSLNDHTVLDTIVLGSLSFHNGTHSPLKAWGLGVIMGGKAPGSLVVVECGTLRYSVDIKAQHRYPSICMWAQIIRGFCDDTRQYEVTMCTALFLAVAGYR